jgi:putative sigma-54 modulation protein
MKFEYTGRHMDVTPAIRRHVEEHFQKIEHIFQDSSTAAAHIIIQVIKNRHIAEVLLHWREHTLTGTDTNADMYQALTRAIDKIEKQVLKLKKKMIDRKQGAMPLSSLAPQETPPPAPTSRRRGGGAGAGMAAAAAVATDMEDASASRAPRIVNARGYRVKPMTAEEAAMSLADDSDQFLVFRDADTDRVSVLYKRKDGNFGLIQP